MKPPFRVCILASVLLGLLAPPPSQQMRRLPARVPKPTNSIRPKSPEGMNSPHRKSRGDDTNLRHKPIGPDSSKTRIDNSTEARARRGGGQPVPPRRGDLSASRSSPTRDTSDTYSEVIPKGDLSAS